MRPTPNLDLSVLARGYAEGRYTPEQVWAIVQYERNLSSETAATTKTATTAPAAGGSTTTTTEAGAK